MRGRFGTRSVFVDTSAWLAAEDSADQWHSEAERLFRQLAAARQWHLVTSNFVVAETHALVLRRGRRAAADFLHRVDRSPSLETVRIAVEDEQAARDIIYHYLDKDFSLVDALSFAVMDRLGIHYAFSFDQHFQQYGKMVLAPDLLQ